MIAGDLVIDVSGISGIVLRCCEHNLVECVVVETQYDVVHIDVDRIVRVI